MNFNEELIQWVLYIFRFFKSYFQTKLFKNSREMSSSNVWDKSVKIDGETGCVVIKPHEYCYLPDSLLPMIKSSLNKVEVNPLPLNTPIYKNKASLLLLISMNESKLG